MFQYYVYANKAVKSFKISNWIWIDVVEFLSEFENKKKSVATGAGAGGCCCLSKWILYASVNLCVTDWIFFLYVCMCACKPRLFVIDFEIFFLSAWGEKNAYAHAHINIFSHSLTTPTITSTYTLAHTIERINLNTRQLFDVKSEKVNEKWWWWFCGESNQWQAQRESRV